MAPVFVAVRVLLGLFFMFTGATKLTDRIFPSLYAEAVNEFVKLAAVFPLNEWGIKLEPMQCLIVVGWIELIGGLLLAIGPRILQEISNIILAVIMMGELYSILRLKEPLYLCMPAAICLGLLLLQLYIWEKEREKQKEE
ncbi:transmembrane protein 35B-like isoform X2 [Heterodontus francisci]|uniref:transmembrane protein 35B-like isoform X2 n=1 Tax=Heterodontus francisci TaxID=7792 RepID=UPI00355B1D47